MRFIIPLVPALGLSGCASMVPSTLAWLSGQTPLDADPAGIAVSLVLPEGLRAKENGARL